MTTTIPDDDLPLFSALSRQQFRKVFQPSRIVLCVLPAETASGVNVITLCFDMYCSYKPPMMAFAIQKGAYSYKLLETASECVLAVPGETMAAQAMYCGTKSGSKVDKVAECGLRLIPSERVSVPGLASAIANVEVRIISKVETGDHLTAFGEVLRFGVNEQSNERCLLSVGPDTDGYSVLAQEGIHRIAVVDMDVAKGATSPK
jgi:flavin reductase (DIM6/NTAB) family NADH-FMN oxidoreductase RutF